MVSAELEAEAVAGVFSQVSEAVEWLPRRRRVLWSSGLSLASFPCEQTQQRQPHAYTNTRSRSETSLLMRGRCRWPLEEAAGRGMGAGRLLPRAASVHPLQTPPLIGP